MATGMMNTTDLPSTRPYLIRALYDWCTDNGFTPYLAVHVDNTVQVPREHVKNNEIVLNIGLEATSALKLGNDFIEFKARFGGTAREIMVPIGHVIAIYARENGQGMAFPGPASLAADTKAGNGLALTEVATERAEEENGNVVPLNVVAGMASDDDDPPKPPSGPRPALKRVK